MWKRVKVTTESSESQFYGGGSLQTVFLSECLLILYLGVPP